MLDDFIYRYKYFISGFLILVILIGGGLILNNKYGHKKSNNQNTEIAELRKQNDDLRAQLSDNSVKEVAGANDQAQQIQEKTDKININTADATELDKLPGIGPTRAADIISYREENGNFKTIEELKNVKGIGDKTFENFKDLITVGE